MPKETGYFTVLTFKNSVYSFRTNFSSLALLSTNLKLYFNLLFLQKGEILILSIGRYFVHFLAGVNIIKHFWGNTRFP